MVCPKPPRGAVRTQLTGVLAVAGRASVLNGNALIFILTATPRRVLGAGGVQESFCVPQSPVSCLHSEKDDNCLHFSLPTVRLEEDNGWEGASELQASTWMGGRIVTVISNNCNYYGNEPAGPDAPLLSPFPQSLVSGTLKPGICTGDDGKGEDRDPVRGKAKTTYTWKG